MTETMWTGEPFPSRWSWRRRKAVRRLSGLLYTSGITRTGGGASMHGNDPVGGWIYSLPRWQDVLPRRSRHLRPYLLFKPDWWWQCHIRQGWQLRGRHTPEPPYAFGICAACVPCVECGAHYECKDECGTGGAAAFTTSPNPNHNTESEST